MVNDVIHFLLAGPPMPDTQATFSEYWTFIFIQQKMCGNLFACKIVHIVSFHTHTTETHFDSDLNVLVEYWANSVE